MPFYSKRLLSVSILTFSLCLNVPTLWLVFIEPAACLSLQRVGLSVPSNLLNYPPCAEPIYFHLIHRPWVYCELKNMDIDPWYGSLITTHYPIIQRPWVLMWATITSRWKESLQQKKKIVLNFLETKMFVMVWTRLD